MPASILIVDDEARLAEVLAVALETRGFDVAFVASVAAAFAHLDSHPVSLVLTDLRMPGHGGRDLLARLHATRPELPVVIMTAYASVRDAVELVKEGAFDYVSKPFEIEDVVATIRRALRLQEAQEENQRLRQELQQQYDFGMLVGDSPPFRTVLRQVAEVCGSRATVLLQGPSGTGKEMVARAIHYNSPRQAKPFVAVNCAAIPEALLESELFGHVKGAFTGAIANREGRFAAAHDGTLFLDEVGDMPLPLQAKLLRAVQEQSFEPVGSTRTLRVDIRLIAATHRDLREEVARGSFREDLFYRLNVFPIAMPALRERDADIPLLAQHFLQRHATAMGKRIIAFAPAAIAAMRRYHWPGNIREVQNCIERAVIVARGATIEVTDLPDYIFGQPDQGQQGIPADLDEELLRVERRHILAALRESNGIQAHAARRLGITERSFWHRLKKLGIQLHRKVDGDGAS